MAFHRLAVPTYFGGLPVGYDYINTPSANGDPGTPAFTDGKKSSGPNQGTYLIAFGEDATSSFANRGLKALAENTDILDNLLRRDIALTVITADVTAASPVSSIVLAGQVFVGEFGVPNNQNRRDMLVSILDNNDHEIINTAGVTVKALLIHDGASNNVVGTQASGFFTSPTVSLNVAIPTGVTYRVYYGERSNLATLPKDAFTSIKIRSAQEVSGEVERVLRDLHAATGATWNDPWLATIASLARTGLDGRYRLASVTDPGSAMDTPGNGGFINRDGPAVRLRAPTYLLNVVGVAGVDKYPDPLLAMLRLERTTPVVGVYDTARGGDVGLVQETPYHNYTDASEVAYNHVTGPLLMDVVPRSITGATVGGAAALTRISSATVASVNPDALTDATSRRTLQVGGSDFVRDGSNRTALRKTDLIEVINNANGQPVGTYRVDTILSSTRFTVKALTGAEPPLGPSGSSAAVRLRWLQPTMSLGGAYRAANPGDAQATPHFFIAQPSYLTSHYDSNALVPYAAFMAASCRRDIGITNLQGLQALHWGGFDLDGTMAFSGVLNGDGGIVVTGGKQRLGLNSNLVQTFGLSHGGTASWNPLQGGHVIIRPATNWSSNPTNLTFAIDTTKGYVAESGDRFRLDIVIPSGSPAVSMTWPGSFLFSQQDGVLPINVTGEIAIVSYEFTYMTFSVPSSNQVWLARRTDYSL